MAKKAQAQAKATATAKEEKIMAKATKTTGKLTMATLAARMDAQDKAIASLTEALTALTTAIAGTQVQAPAKESKQEKKSTKSTKSTKDSKPRKPAPTKEQWLAFKQENADKVAHLKTRHERNSALYKLYMAA